ncbi:HAMP domain-containing sensor histidine kinase [Actinocrinis sp.]|uniref:HAMP domain-containing sensor histidine kinase n=1 Tax=Actinocrinis sp. TaxID=1920516 RepID=UPI002BACF517|nr:ATP-binding protein [Actinocrinis sp.]HXR72221.1 ATP-binding protein [Actinocrinis sp.]
MLRRLLARFPRLHRIWLDLRPLDPVRSIKAKLGILVIASVTFAGSFTAIGVSIGIRARYVVLTAIVLSMIVTQILAHGMTSPLRRMTAAARAMAAGDYSRRIRASSQDEVGELAGAFNQMAADLGAADRQRRELIANVSHELRTPISVLRAVLENVVDGVTEPDDAIVKAALTQTERLGRLVEELLDLSRLEAGAVPLDLSDFAVEPFLARAVDEAAAAGRPVRFELGVDPHDLTARADQSRLHQVVANLVDNAAKHSPPGGVVRVSAQARPGGGIRVEVADEGPGIPEGERTRVFERFTRGGDGGGQVTGGGTGLGLAIARWAIELHGGTIEVAPSTRGALIRVELPADPHSAPGTGAGSAAPGKGPRRPRNRSSK